MSQYIKTMLLAQLQICETVVFTCIIKCLNNVGVAFQSLPELYRVITLCSDRNVNTIFTCRFQTVVLYINPASERRVISEHDKMTTDNFERKLTYDYTFCREQKMFKIEVCAGISGGGKAMVVFHLEAIFHFCERTVFFFL